MSVIQVVICEFCSGNGCFTCKGSGKLFQLTIKKDNYEPEEKVGLIVERSSEIINRLIECVNSYEELVRLKDKKIVELEDEIKLLKSN